VRFRRSVTVQILIAAQAAQTLGQGRQCELRTKGRRSSCWMSSPTRQSTAGWRAALLWRPSRARRRTRHYHSVRPGPGASQWCTTRWTALATSRRASPSAPSSAFCRPNRPTSHRARRNLQSQKRMLPLQAACRPVRVCVRPGTRFTARAPTSWSRGQTRAAFRAVRTCSPSSAGRVNSC